MRPSRTALSLTVLASVPAALAFGLWGSSSSAAPRATAAAAAPVAAVAHAAPRTAPVVAPRTTHATTHAATHAPRTAAPRPAATHRSAATRTAPKPEPKPTTTRPATRPTTRTAAVRATSTTKTGDDYPYAGATGDTADKWGFTERQCVSFAAWRLARGGHAIDNSQGWGSALHWDETARARGVRVSSTPRVGAIAHWNAGEPSKAWVGSGVGTFTAGPYGHVGWVAAVYSDGSALIEQYNAQGDRAYSVMRMTAPRYLF